MDQREREGGLARRTNKGEKGRKANKRGRMSSDVD